MQDINDKKIKELHDAFNSADKDYQATKAVSLALESAANNSINAAANEVMATAVGANTVYALSTVYEAYAAAKSIADAAITAADEAWEIRETARIKCIYPTSKD